MKELLSKTVKISSKGQVVIPIALRRSLDLQDGDEISLMLNDANEIILKKLPTALDWHNLVAEIPNEKVEINSKGYYNPEQAPHFHKWMLED